MGGISMNSAQQFRKSVTESSLGTLRHVLDDDNKSLIEQHLVEFGHDAEIKNHPFTNDDGVSCDSIDLIFNDQVARQAPSFR
jgi:hypothetical protein